MKDKTVIAIAGNPNCGKTTLFNALTGARQYVGNWPGVTVEKKEGKLKGHEDVTIQDLPGIYSLSPYTLEEVVSRKYLIEAKPDAILNIVDGTNLERNLYLSTQLAELGIPMILAVNMIDLVEKRDDRINCEKIGKELGCRVVKISALKGTGTIEAAEAAIQAAKNQETPKPIVFSKPVEKAVNSIAALIQTEESKKRFYAVKVFERHNVLAGYLRSVGVSADTAARDACRIEHDLSEESYTAIRGQIKN